MTCHRAIGRSIMDCERCRMLPWDRENGGGWRPCPPARTFKRIGQHHLTAAERRVLDNALRRSTHVIGIGVAVAPQQPSQQFTGDICADCGSLEMVRTRNVRDVPAVRGKQRGVLMKAREQIALRLIAGGSLANSPRRSFGLPHPLSWAALFYGAFAWAALIGLVWFVVVVL